MSTEQPEILSAIEKVMETLTALKEANPQGFADVQDMVLSAVVSPLALARDDKPFDYAKAMGETLGQVNTDGVGVHVGVPVLTEEAVDVLAGQMSAAMTSTEAAVQVALSVLAVALAAA